MQMIADLMWVEAEYVKGITSFEALAAKLSAERPYEVSSSMVRRDLERLKKRWLAIIDSRLEISQAAELRKLAEQEREVWNAWESSKEATTRTTMRKKGEGGKGDVEHSVEKRTNAGEPAFQRLLLDIAAARAKILGLNAPIRVEQSGVDGQPIKTENVNVTLTKPLSAENMPDAEVDAMLRRFYTAQAGSVAAGEPSEK